MPDVTAIVTTFERPDDCERAVRSALAQDPQPCEVLVCDDGSSDDTPERMHAWEAREARVRYLRVDRNSGTPAVTRNLGVAEARAPLVAFLDDDDEWLPGKLAAQLAEAAGADVIAGNARRTSGDAYFPAAPDRLRPTLRDIHTANPIVTSSALVDREALLAAGGFPEARWMRGIEDYAGWLALADRGARFVVLGQALVLYADTADGRFGAVPIRPEIALARLAWRRAAACPTDPARLRNALNRSVGALATLRRTQASPIASKMRENR